MVFDPKVIRSVKLTVDFRKWIDFEAGITEAIKLSQALSQEVDTEVSFDFNGVVITVNKETTLKEAYKTYIEKSGTPTVERFETKPIDEAPQVILNQLSSTMDSVDFSRLEQTIPYLSQVIKNSDRFGTRIFDHERLKEKLKEYGYSENLNDEQEIDENDREATGKWLVGQYMIGFHPLISQYMDDWEERFIKPEQK